MAEAKTVDLIAEGRQLAIEAEHLASTCHADSDGHVVFSLENAQAGALECRWQGGEPS